jgi:hypothetical protein
MASFLCLEVRVFIIPILHLIQLLSYANIGDEVRWKLQKGNSGWKMRRDGNGEKKTLMEG